MTGVGEVMTNIGSGAWHVIEANKPSSSLASNVCNAVPDGVTDPMTELTEARGPNSFVWRMKMEKPSPYVGRQGESMAKDRPL